MALLVPLGEATDGEKKMLDYLQRKLPDDWFVVGNPVVRQGRVNRELDAVIIGDRSVWVVEEKSFGGCITGDEHVWILPDGKQVDGIMRKLLIAAKLVNGLIAAKQPSLKRVYVDSVVLLTAPRVQLRVNDSSVQYHVRRLSGCEKHFLSATDHKTKLMTQSERRLVLRSLVGDILVDRLGGLVRKEAGVERSIGADEKRSNLKGVFVRLDGGFRRVYYDDVSLGRKELRGAQPYDAVQALKGKGVRLRFDGGKVRLETLCVAHEVRLGGRLLDTGEAVFLRRGVSILRIGEIKLRTTVTDLPLEDAYE